MKKIKLLILALSAFCFFNINAQIMIGPKLGLNLASFSNITTTGSEKKVPNMGINFGGVFNFAFGDMFSLQPELLYSGKGCKTKDGDDYFSENTNYLEMPILFKGSFGKKDFKVFVNLGPYFGYWMSGKSIIKISGDKTTESITFDENQGINPDGSTYTAKPNRLDIGLAFGAGVLYKLGPGSLMGELRYDLGLSNLTKYTGTEPPDAENIKNRVFTISVGYLFKIGK